MRWDHLEALLADYYAAQGYIVEHVGTGGSGKRFDGGIDLKLRKDDEYILVQCKGWNAYQVPHNAVHQLIGLMVNEGATGSILVTSGEFTNAALEAAARGGHVRLVDGDALREMLAPLLATEAPLPSPRWTGSPTIGGGHGTGGDPSRAGGRAVVHQERERRTGHQRRRKATAITPGIGMRLVFAAVSIAVFFLAVHFATSRMKSALSTGPMVVRPGTPMPGPARSPEELSRRPPPSVPQRPTEAEIRESQRKAEEAMKIIEATTPEV